MKKLLCALLLALALLSLAACGQKDDTSNDRTANLPTPDAEASQGLPAENAPETTSTEPPPSDDAVEVDLTELNSLLVYAEVCNILSLPDSYLGKVIKMRGQFTYYEDPDTKKQYFSCTVSDETACCFQGLEFILTGSPTYPDDYPQDGAEITVIGVFQSYEENGIPWYHLVNARLA